MRSGVLAGIFWVGVSTTLGRFVRFIAIFLLAGLLEPESFGLYASLYVIIDGLCLLQTFGLGHSLVYSKSEDPASDDTAFIMSVGFGILLFTLALLFADHVETFMASPGIAGPFRFCASLLILQSLQLVPAGQFERGLDFRKKFLPTAVSSITFLTIAVVLAMRGAGVWALVYGEVGALLSSAITNWCLSDWRPRFRFRWKHAATHIRFGWPVLGGIATIYLLRSIDRFVLSRAEGAHELGVYSFAITIALIPANVFVRILNTVLYPHYASGESQLARNLLFLDGTRAIAGLGVLFGIGIYFFSHCALSLAYGDKWLGAVAPLAILVVLGICRAQIALSGDLFMGSGRPRLFRLMNAIQLGAGGAFLWLAPGRHAVETAWAMTAAGVLTLVVVWIVTPLTLRVSGLAIAGCWRGPLLAGTTTAACWWLGARWIDPAHVFSTAAVLVVGCSLYVAIWLALDSPARDIAQKTLARVRATSPPAGA